MATPAASPGSPNSDFITAREAAVIMGLNRYTVYRWLRFGFVPHHRYGRTIRVSRSDLLRFMAEHQSWAAPPGWSPPSASDAPPRADTLASW